MRDFNLLYGFNAEQTAEKLSRALRALGYRANAFMRPSKPLIKDYLLKQGDLDGVILKEYLDGGDIFSIDEFVEMADTINVNFVILLSNKHRGKDDMKKLYAAGILNVYFLDGKVGADPLKLAELLTRGRVRKEAREYYHIDNELLDRSLLTYADYSDNYKYLTDQTVGLNIVDRFVTISKWLSPKQMARFIDMLPDKVINVLRKYDEYYVVQTSLFRARAMPNKERKPKDVRQALPEEYMMQLLSEGVPTVRPRQDRIYEPVAVRTDSSIDYSQIHREESYGNQPERSGRRADRYHTDESREDDDNWSYSPYKAKRADAVNRSDVDRSDIEDIEDEDDISYPEPAAEEPFEREPEKQPAPVFKEVSRKPQRVDAVPDRDRREPVSKNYRKNDEDMRSLSTEDLIEMYS